MVLKKAMPPKLPATFREIVLELARERAILLAIGRFATRLSHRSIMRTASTRTPGNNSGIAAVSYGYAPTNQIRLATSSGVPAEAGRSITTYEAARMTRQVIISSKSVSCQENVYR